MSVEVHVAGEAIRVGPRVRQRCSWCGALIEDVDLSRVAVLQGSEGSPWPSWPLGALVARDGGATWVMEHTPGDPIPAGACALLDPEVTS